MNIYLYIYKFLFGNFLVITFLFIYNKNIIFSHYIFILVI